MSSDEQDFSPMDDMFEEPSDYHAPPPAPTQHTVARQEGCIPDGTPAAWDLVLVGHHSLWAHCLWNAGVFLAHHFDAHPELVRGKTVLELGAAAALPSFAAATQGAALSVATDYPEKPLIDMITNNAEKNLPAAVANGSLVVQGYLWGADPQPLLDRLPEGKTRFDLLVLADLLFNHSEHHAMLRSVQNTMAEDGQAIVIFSSHRPWKADADLNFFNLAKEAPYHFEVEKVLETKMKPMFENDPGCEEIRSTVLMFSLRHGKPASE
ncbi:hypothetical protein H696_03632 [Fonticula alba]|uniref:Uncharacterized protein n=1 Tax=Fonticula alba TaxID=691883 RepID=A0A058Z8C2_FONAL|nr:hypothetical protein H696_03632 [Fonticula alba]KCV70173.1 hypothetical protein H696_03632 [Fonticula alba]|eukprot:XP_009495779.1 hypothetical protein H696_03632 [Fonticula alba]